MFSVKKLSIATAGIAIGLGSIAPVNAASLYAITGLDFLPSDINDSAQVVGQQYLWQNGNVTNLNTLSGANNSDLLATSINNNGAIVGGGLTVNESTIEQETIPFQAFISDGSTISDLRTDSLCSFYCDYNIAEDINDSGTIALIYGTDRYSGYLLASDGTNLTEGEPIISRELYNLAINNQDQIVGTGRFSGGFINGIFSEEPNSQTSLIAASDDPNNPSFPPSGSKANDIDDLGNIVGLSITFSSSTSNGEFVATLWEDATQPGVSLGTLGGEFSDALGINNSQQVVGTSSLTNGSIAHAFLWEDDQMIDLNSLVDPGTGWELTSAFEINDNGDIIGIGLYNGVQRGFIATAVPEPSSVLGVLGLGLFGLSNWRKRQKKSS